jgi:small subunit ribosomal protein S20
LLPTRRFDAPAGRHHTIPLPGKFAAKLPFAKAGKPPYNARLSSQANLGVTMANSAQARKRARQADKQRDHNASLRSELRTAIKRVAKAIESGDKAAAKVVFSESTSIVDSIADKKIIHKNKAARHKSRLSAAIKAMA